MTQKGVTMLSEGDDVVVYADGICCASVCAKSSLTKEDVERWMNERAAGSDTLRWTVAKERFKSGHPNPCPCNSRKDRWHWLLHC